MKITLPKIKFNKTAYRGFSLVEIILSLGVFSLMVVPVIQLLWTTRDASYINTQKTKAVFYAGEYLEEIKNIRLFGWNNLTNGRFIINQDTDHNLTLEPTADSETIETFSRYLLIEDGWRDDLGNLVDTDGEIDPSTKKITVDVSWTGWHPGSYSQSVYLTRYLENMVKIWDSFSELNRGTNSGTIVVTDDNGKVVLGSGGSADWCEPSLTIAGLDLPKNGTAKTVTAIEGYAFAGTGENASGESYVKIGISDSPIPTPTILGILDGYKTNDVFGEANFGYIATDNHQKEVVVIDISSVPYSEVAYFNAPGNGVGNSVFILDKVGYVTVGNKLYNFDLNNVSDNLPAIDPDGVTLAGIGNSIMVRGKYAYVAEEGTTRQLEIINIYDSPTDMTVEGWANVNGQGGQDLFVTENQQRTYLVTHSSTTQKEFFVIDTLVKAGLRPVLGSYDTQGMDPKGVEIVPGRAIVVGVGGIQYQVLDISQDNDPQSCGPGLEVPAGIYDSASVIESDNDAYTYIVTGDASQEFRIIAGGPGGQFSAFGIYESETLDTGHPTVFNRLFIEAEKYVGVTDISFKVAVKDAIDGSCNGVNFSDSDFVGPDKLDTGDFFYSDGAIPFDDDGLGFENPGQCFRFRAYLTTNDFSRTPVLYKFTINYSP